MVARNCCFSISSGTTALFGAVLPLGRYYREHVTVLPLPAKLHHIPAFSLILFVVFVGLCSFFLVVLRVLVFGSR